MTASVPEPEGRRRRRRFLILVVVAVVVATVAGLALAWYLFFGSEAPPAPTLDDAVRLLLPSVPPG